MNMIALGQSGHISSVPRMSRLKFWSIHPSQFYTMRPSERGQSITSRLLLSTDGLMIGKLLRLASQPDHYKKFEKLQRHDCIWTIHCL